MTEHAAGLSTDQAQRRLREIGRNLIPEAPALALGVQRTARRKVVVRRLSAVKALPSASSDGSQMFDGLVREFAALQFDRAAHQTGEVVVMRLSLARLLRTDGRVDEGES